MTDKISIKGTPRKFDQAELEQRQQGYHNVYRNTDQCCTVVRGDIPYQFLAKVIEMSEQGYTLTGRYPISFDRSLNCNMIKPEHVQATDLEAINERVKQEYIAELESERAEYRELLTTQLLQSAQLKEQRKEEDKKAKLLAEIEKEVTATFGDLVIPE
jgi:hypothetical protein